MDKTYEVPYEILFELWVPRDCTRSSRRRHLHGLFSQIPRSIHEPHPLFLVPKISKLFLEITNFFQVLRDESPLPEF